MAYSELPCAGGPAKGMPLMARALAGTCMLAFLAASPADAHAILMQSTPPTGGHAAAGTLAISMHYNSLIDVKRSRLVLIGPDQREVKLQIARAGAGDTITASAAVTPGRQILRWQVLAVDGHITRGEIPFDAEAKAGQHEQAGAR